MNPFQTQLLLTLEGSVAMIIFLLQEMHLFVTFFSSI